MKKESMEEGDMDFTKNMDIEQRQEVERETEN